MHAVVSKPGSLLSDLLQAGVLAAMSSRMTNPIVSGGLGFSMVPVRVGARPEILSIGLGSA